MDEKSGQPRSKESYELRARLARELVETRALLVEATDSLRRVADVPAMVRAEIPRRLNLALGRHPLSSTLAFALAGFVLARLVVGRKQRRGAPQPSVRVSSGRMAKELLFGTLGFLLKPALKEVMVHGIRSRLNRPSVPRSP